MYIYTLFASCNRGQIINLSLHINYLRVLYIFDTYSFLKITFLPCIYMLMCMSHFSLLPHYIMSIYCIKSIYLTKIWYYNIAKIGCFSDNFGIFLQYLSKICKYTLDYYHLYYSRYRQKLLQIAPF